MRMKGERRGDSRNKNAERRSFPIRIRHSLSAIKQKLNCALPFQSSSSLDAFHCRGLHGISEIPKNFGLSRRPKSTLNEFRVNFSLERR